jgi:hypothetical protein
LSIQLTRTRRECNHIIVISITDNVVHRGEVYDRDPLSPSRWTVNNDLPMFFQIEGLTSLTECVQAAQRLAFKLFTRHVSHTFAMIQNPVPDFNDSIQVGDKVYTVDQVAFSLEQNNPMYLTGRGEIIAL